MMNNSKEFIDSLSITVLIEDYAGYDSGLLAQHGVSFYVEARSGERKLNLLFDTGQSAEPLLNNMARLKVDPTAIDLIVLSHCHYDHTGGLLGALQAIGSKRLPVIAHPEIFRQHFGEKPVFSTFGLMPAVSERSIKEAGGDLILSADPLTLLDGITTSGEIEGRVAIEQTSTLEAFTIKEGRKVPDTIADDLSLFFKTAAGLVILTGCSHAGILSITAAAKEVTGMQEVAAIIGGFHLIGASSERIMQTAKTFSQLQNLQVYTGHCTGFKAERLLADHLGDRFHKLYTGQSIKFEF
jgi:7,8-dihydropterin-6-yl-methyl-4-(beta-D-ribofuranosyl)aminobenzene 5'-phosphate synthase